jgi:hypothetical protein
MSMIDSLTEILFEINRSSEGSYSRWSKVLHVDLVQKWITG